MRDNSVAFGFTTDAITRIGGRTQFRKLRAESSTEPGSRRFSIVTRKRLSKLFSLCRKAFPALVTGWQTRFSGEQRYCRSSLPDRWITKSAGVYYAKQSS